MNPSLLIMWFVTPVASWNFSPYLAIRPVGPNGNIFLYCFLHVHKKYKTRIGNRQIGVCGLLAKNRFNDARDRFKQPAITTDRTVTIATPPRAIRQFEIWFNWV
jgi:hypothetical protein